MYIYIYTYTYIYIYIFIYSFHQPWVSWGESWLATINSNSNPASLSDEAPGDVNGDGCVLSVASTLGQDVLKMVSRQLPWKKGARISLHHLDLPLMLHQTLQEQGIVDNMTLSCTFVPSDLFAAWSYLKGFPVPEAEVALEGLTWIAGKISTESLQHLPRSLENLTLSPGTYSLEEVPWPSALRCLTLDGGFNQEMKGAVLPNGLQELTFGRDYNQSLVGVSLPSNLKRVRFGDNFGQSL